MSYASLLQYGMQSPMEFGMLQSYNSLDPSTWTETQQEAYLKWASAEMVPSGHSTAMEKMFGATRLTPVPETQVPASGYERYLTMERQGTDFVRTTNDPAGSWTVSEQWDGRGDVDDILAEYERGSLMRYEYPVSTSEGSTVSSYDPWGSDYAATASLSYVHDREDLLEGIEEEPLNIEEFDIGSMGDFPGEFDIGSMGDFPGETMEMPALPEELVGTTAGEIKPFRTAGGEALRESNMERVVLDLNSLPEIPELPESLFTELGVTPEQLAPVLESAFEGMSPTGSPMFSLGGIAGGIQGLIVNMAGVQPFMDWLKENAGVFGEVVNYTVNVAGALNMLWAMDPIAWGGLGLYWVGQQMATQMNRVQDNNYSGDKDSSRFVMVKDQGVFYPGVLVGRTKGEGPVDDSDYIHVRYGRPEDFFIKFEDGAYRGHFKNQKNRQFRMYDDEWLGEKSTHEWAITNDPMKQYYFLSDAERNQILNTYGTENYDWKVIPEDRESYTPYGKKMTEVARTLDFIQNQERKTADPTTFMESESKGIRMWIQNDIKHMTPWGVTDSSWVNPTGGIGIPIADEGWGRGTKFDGTAGYGAVGWGEFSQSLLPRQMQKLETARDRAAHSIQMMPALYIDSAKKLPPAKSFEELQAQYTAIENYTDRNNQQKDYLRAKAATKWEMNQVEEMGFGNQLYDALAKEENMYVTDDENNISAGILPKVLYGEYLRPYEEGDEEDRYATRYKKIPAYLDLAEDGHNLESIIPSYITIDDWQRDKLEEGYRGDVFRNPEAPANQALWQFVQLEVIRQQESGELRTITRDGDDVPESPEDVIMRAGLKTRATWVENERASREKIEQLEDIQPTPPEVEEEEEEEKPDWFDPVLDSPEERERRFTHIYRVRTEYNPTTQERVKGLKRKIPRAGGFEAAYQAKRQVKTTPKERWAQVMADYHREVEATAQLKRDHQEAASTIFNKLYGQRVARESATHFTQGEMQGEEINYSNWKSRVQDFLFESSEIGESSYPHAIEAVLYGDSNWIPKDVPLSEENLPSWWVTENEDAWKPLLARIDMEDNPEIKKRANYLHNLVGKKDSATYTERFHPTANMDTAELAKHLAGTHGQLSDDWSAPYKHHMNSVTFNGELHSQLDVGIVETY